MAENAFDGETASTGGRESPEGEEGERRRREEGEENKRKEEVGEKKVKEEERMRTRETNTSYRVIDHHMKLIKNLIQNNSL